MFTGVYAHDTNNSIKKFSAEPNNEKKSQKISALESLKFVRLQSSNLENFFKKSNARVHYLIEKCV